MVEQGFVTLLDRVYASGEPYVGRRALVNLQQAPDGALNERYLDFIYQPIVADEGATTGIFIQGHDVTEQHETEQAIRAESRKLDVFEPHAALRWPPNSTWTRSCRSPPTPAPRSWTPNSAPSSTT